jgi:hypothetical protein
MKDWLEIQFWKVGRWLIQRGYGASCEIPDYEDFEDHPRELNAQGRCGSCRAREVIEWINLHIDLLQM